MATLTIRNLDEHVQQRLRTRAAEHHRSVEAEVRDILTRVVNPPFLFGAALLALGQEIGGVDLDLPQRESQRAVDLA